MGDLLQWWNLLYVLAFFFAMLYAVLNAIGLSGGGEGGVEAAAGGADAGVEADAAPEADIHHELPPDFVHASDHPAAAANLGLLNEALSFFGIGRVPFTALMMAFLLTFSVAGWIANLVLSRALPSPLLFFPLSCAGALFLGLTAMRLCAQTLGKYLKPIESAAVDEASLTGGIATATIPVNGQFGQAIVHDSYGTIHKVVCRTEEGKPAIPSGKSVLLVRYVREKRVGRRGSGYFFAEPYEVPEP